MTDYMEHMEYKVEFTVSSNSTNSLRSKWVAGRKWGEEVTPVYLYF